MSEGNQQYTVFSASGFQGNALPKYEGGRKTTSELRAESLRAGRLIVKEGDRWIARGTTQEAPFRIGGVYRDRSGRLIRIKEKVAPIKGGLGVAAGYYEGTAPVLVQADDGEGWYDTGWRRLSDGGYYDYDQFCLIPGELHQVNGEWLPITEVTFTAKIEPREERNAIGCKECGWGLVLGCWRCGSSISHQAATIAKPEASPERIEERRAPLTWNKPTKVDRWAGFTVKTNATESAQQDRHTLQQSPDLQSASHQVNGALFGSADLVR